MFGINKNNSNTFSVYRSELDGKPLFATIDTKYSNYSEKSRFNWFLSISMPLVDPTHDGLTTRGEANELNKTEDLLEKKIAQIGDFCHIGRVTWNGYREVIYYVNDPEKIAKSLQDIIDSGEFRDFSFRCEKDDDWKNVQIYFDMQD